MLQIRGFELGFILLFHLHTFWYYLKIPQKFHRENGDPHVSGEGLPYSPFLRRLIAIIFSIVASASLDDAQPLTVSSERETDCGSHLITLPRFPPRVIGLFENRAVMYATSFWITAQLFGFRRLSTVRPSRFFVVFTIS